MEYSPDTALGLELKISWQEYLGSSNAIRLLKHQFIYDKQLGFNLPGGQECDLTEGHKIIFSRLFSFI